MTSKISIPVIDISDALRVQPGFGKQPELEAVAQAIDDACCEVGFFAITGHGINQKIIGDAWNAAAAFFDLSLEEKLCVPTPTPQHAYGYSPMTAETLARSLGDDSLPDLKESLSIGPLELPPEIPLEAKGLLVETDWPAKPAELHPAWERYFAEMSELSARLLSIMAIALKLEPTYFEPMLRYHSSALRAVNYPHLAKLPQPGQLRAGAHTDYGTLSILTFGGAAAGLEIRIGENWTAVPHISDSFVVNLGDMMARWTNDRWVSTLHRVVLPPNLAEAAETSETAELGVPAEEGESVEVGEPAPPTEPPSNRRQSLVFFHNAAWDAEVKCIPTCLKPGEKPKYEPVLAGPHLLSKFASTVGDY